MDNTRYRAFATQANLILFKQRLTMSTKGLHFLKRKRDVLSLHLRDIAKEQAQLEETITNDYMEAILTINRAKFLDVDLFPLSIVGYESVADGHIIIQTKNIVGILVESMSYIYNPYRYDNSLAGLSRGGKAILGIRLAFVQFLSSLVNIGSLLIADIQITKGVVQTSIRTNALEYLVIPRTTGTVDFIKTELDEMGREDFYRIKKMKTNKLEKARRKEKEEQYKYNPETNRSINKDLRARSTILLAGGNTTNIPVKTSFWEDL